MRFGRVSISFTHQIRINLGASGKQRAVNNLMSERKGALFTILLGLHSVLSQVILKCLTMSVTTIVAAANSPNVTLVGVKRHVATETSLSAGSCSVWAMALQPAHASDDIINESSLQRSLLCSLI